MKLKYNKNNDRYYGNNTDGGIYEFHCGDNVKVFLDNTEEINGLWFRFEMNIEKPKERQWFLINEKHNLFIFSPFNESLTVELRETTNSADLNQIEAELKQIENEENYYAMFPYSYERAVKIRETVATLFHNEKIDDIKFRDYCERINVAKISMISCIKKWIVTALERKEQLTTKEIVYSTFAVLFKEN